MQRPYIICHMTMSIDGKVTGEFLRREAHGKVSEIYYQINRDYKADAYACGRITMEGSFTGGWYPDLSMYDKIESKTDYLTTEKTGFYAVALDPKGKLGWKSNRIIDIDKDPGYDNAQIIEILTHSADKRYLSYLQHMEIPYIFAGETEINVKEAMFKLKEYFQIEKLLLEGGSITNGTFQREGIIDELSLVVDSAVGGSDDKPLFMDSSLEDYKLFELKNYDGILYLNYKKQQ